RRRHTRFSRDWSSDVCSSDLPESKVERTGHRGFDVVGLMVFMITVLAMMIVLIFGKQLGWTNIITVGLVVLAAAGLVSFVRWERSEERRGGKESTSGRARNRT